MQPDIYSFQSISGNVKNFFWESADLPTHQTVNRRCLNNKKQGKTAKTVTKRLKLFLDYGNSKTPRTVRNENSGFSLVIVSFFNFLGQAAGAGALYWPYTQRNTNNTLTK